MDNSTNSTEIAPAEVPDDTNQIILGSVLGFFLFGGAMLLLSLFLHRLQKQEDKRLYDANKDFSKVVVNRPVFLFQHAAADDEDDEIMVTSAAGSQAALTTTAKPVNRSERHEFMASIADHDVVVGSMKDLSLPAAPSSVTVEPFELPGDAVEDNDVTFPPGEAAHESSFSSPGIQRGGPHSATVAVVRINPGTNEFEEAVRLARKPPQSMKLRSTYDDGAEQPLSFDFDQLGLAHTTPEHVATAEAPERKPDGTAAGSPTSPGLQRQVSTTPSLKITLCADGSGAGNGVSLDGDEAQSDSVLYPLAQSPPKRPTTPKPNRKLRPGSTTSNGSSSSAAGFAALSMSLGSSTL